MPNTAKRDVTQPARAGLALNERADDTNLVMGRYPSGYELPVFEVDSNRRDSAGFFRFGRDVVCFGSGVGEATLVVDGGTPDIGGRVRTQSGHIVLPFDPGEVIDNLRCERYLRASTRRPWVEASWVQSAYYSLRPLLPVSVRKHMQRVYLRGWENVTFPRWPVDRSVDLLFERLLTLTLEALDIDRLPFIWFWPEGSRACAIVTHDVETRTGRDFTEALIGVDQEYDFNSAFQIVPETRYEVPSEYLAMIRERGCEINVHGLDHVGNLFGDRQKFLEAAGKINSYGALFGSTGFRSPALYRNADWFRDLEFSYDMSFPNVARLEAQHGGCCTLMPYFLPGGMLELPLTTAEDYTLFHILKGQPMDVWERQIDSIVEGNGLISILVHPDYVSSDREMDVYRSLLEKLAGLRDQNIWCALPGEVDVWWRARQEMTLTAQGDSWVIEGAGSDRACVAYASVDGGRLAYELDV